MLERRGFLEYSSLKNRPGHFFKTLEKGVVRIRFSR